MRVTLFISFGLMAILGTGQASGQSAFLDKGQSGTAVRLTYLHERHTTGFELGAGFSTERRSDINVGVFMLSSAGVRAYGGGLGVTFLKSSEDSDALGGLQITLQYLDPPGRGGPTLTGSAGINQDFPISTGSGTRFVFSMAASVVYVLSAYHLPADRTFEVFQAGMGQSISTGNGSFWLLSVAFGYSTAPPSHGFVGIEIGFLFPD